MALWLSSLRQTPLLLVPIAPFLRMFSSRVLLWPARNKKETWNCLQFQWKLSQFSHPGQRLIGRLARHCSSISSVWLQVHLNPLSTTSWTERKIARNLSPHLSLSLAHFSLHSRNLSRIPSSVKSDFTISAASDLRLSSSYLIYTRFTTISSTVFIASFAIVLFTIISSIMRWKPNIALISLISVLVSF